MRPTLEVAAVSVPAPAPAAPEPDGELFAIGRAPLDSPTLVAWHREQLGRLGYHPLLAAERCREPVDLARLRSLVACGCELELAWRIVS